MRVQLIAYTHVTDEALELLSMQDDSQDADYLAEFTGRDCYQSFDRPNPETARTSDYVQKNLIGKQHYSVLEHASATLRLTGISRSLTHELVRHRHLSYSQLSQRYVDQEDFEKIVPPLIRDWPDEKDRMWMLQRIEYAWRSSQDAYAALEGFLRDPERQGEVVQIKRAREAARAVLPNMTETIIDVTGNHRAWREMLALRLSPHADAEIRELAEEILVTLSAVAPATYADLANV